MSSLKLECLDDSGNDLFLVHSVDGISIKKTSNALSITEGGSLTVMGGASFAKDVFIGSRLNVESITLNNIVQGVSSLFSASFIAANNVTIPENVTGLTFPNSAIRAFKASISVTILKTGGNLFEVFDIDGFQTDSGWTLNTTKLGDTSGIAFNITSSGQIQYTSTNIVNWQSSTFRYFVNQISNTGTYDSLLASTNGTYQFNSIQINNTTGPILGSENGSLYSLGGALFEKNIIIKSTVNSNGIGSGGSLTVLGGAAISKTLQVGEGITTSNINFTGNLFQNGVPYVGSQWTTTAGNLSYTSGSVIVTNITGDNASFTSVTASNTRFINATMTSLRLTNMLSTNITTSNLFASSGMTGSNSLFTNITTGGVQTTTLVAFTGVTGANSFFTNATMTGLQVINANATNISTSTLIASGMYVSTAGNVGIGTTNPSYKLHVSGGDIYATGDVFALSDMRHKSSILQIDNALDITDKLRGVYYTNTSNNRRNIGIIAQETESVLPEVVHTDENGLKGVSYGNIVALLIESVKNLRKNCPRKFIWNVIIINTYVEIPLPFVDCEISDIGVYIQSKNNFGRSKYDIIFDKTVKQHVLQITTTEDGEYHIMVVI
jgi:hypothetical protein